MKKILLDFIADTIAGYYGITKKSMLSKNQAHKYLIPRQMFMYFLYDENLTSLAETGRYCDRTHATVLNAVEMIKNDIKHSRSTREDYYTLRNFILNRSEVEFVVSKLLSSPSEVLSQIKIALNEHETANA